MTTPVNADLLNIHEYLGITSSVLRVEGRGGKVDESELTPITRGLACSVYVAN